MLFCQPPTIFRGAPSDYNTKVMNYRKYAPNYDFYIRNVARIIKEETGFNPLEKLYNRRRELVESRQIFTTLLYKHIGWSQHRIAGIIGSENHCIVYYSKGIIDNLCETDKKFRETYIEIENRVKLLIK